MTNLTELQNLVDRFHANIDFYKDARNAYNEHSCRIEYIDPLLKLLGWDVANEKGLAPQYREVIAENYSTRTDRPDYTITLRGVPKFFVEAKKPAVDITRVAAPAIQTRKYGWNAKHRLAVLTNFEYLAIYDTCHIAHEDDGCAVARYRLYHYTEYVEKVEEIAGFVLRLQETPFTLVTLTLIWMQTFLQPKDKPSRLIRCSSLKSTNGVWPLVMNCMLRVAVMHRWKC